MDVAVTVTQAVGEGIDVARQAAVSGDFAAIVAVGGDSTINEVVNGLVQAAGAEQAGTLGIIPLGTANDLADQLHIPRQLAAACARLRAAQTRIIDVGQVNERFFVNNSAVGLEAVVTVAASKMTRFKGPLRYIWAAVRSIWNRPAWQAHIRWGEQAYQGTIALVSVGNTARTGGSFFMTPDARMDDGQLDFVFAPAMPPLKLLTLLPQTFAGRHVYQPQVVYERTASLEIEMAPTPIQVDGELVDLAGTHFVYRIHPQKLRVIC